MNAFDYLFENRTTSDKIFVVGGSVQITYRELYNRSLSIACFIEEQVGFGEKIVVQSKNSTSFIALYLGIIKSGNIFVPLDPGIEPANLTNIPTNRVFLLEGISKLPFCVVDEATSPILPLNRRGLVASSTTKTLRLGF